MPNLKMLFGKTKGHIAEMLAKHHLHYAYRPRELPIDLLNKFKITVPHSIKEFLRAHWMSIDLFGFELENYVVKNLILYEVKGRNHYSNPAKIWRPKLTSNAHSIYTTALSQGYVLKYVEVLFRDNWNYDVVTCDMCLDAFQIDDGNLEFRKKKPEEVARQQH